MASLFYLCSSLVYLERCWSFSLSKTLIENASE